MAEQRSTLIIEISSEQAARNARALDRELQSIERTGNYATTSMNSMSVAARQLAGYLAGVVTVGTAIAKMDDWTNLNNRLRLVTTSQKALNVAMQDTFDIAQRSGAAWGGTATIYQKIQYNSEKLGLSQEKVAKITESISKSISNSGSSAQAASAALYQLGQSFDKSSLNGDEFVSMSENAGYLMEVFAKGLGVTRAELKEMSSQGLLTTDKMVQAIEKMSGSIEEDFGKTNFTIGQSFTQLSNAVTKFVGEAGQGSGAASTLSSSIKTLADNLGFIANIAMLGGVAALTKTILTQTAAMKTAIGTSINRRVALLSELQAQAQVTARELSRTAAVAQLRSMQLADAQATMARMTGLQRLAYLQSTVLPLERANTVAIAAHAAATEADTIAQNANNAARSVAARLFSAVGGTVGVLTIGVTALAAGYMYMSGKAAEANRKLQEQAEVAKKAKEELLALKGLEKDDAIDDMTASFKRQNEALTESSSKINMQLNAIEQLYKGNKDVVKVVQDARNGTISMNEAVAKFNELRISKDVYNSIKANTAEFVKNATEAGNSKYKLSLFGIEVELSGRKAQTGALGVDQNSESLDKNKTAAEKAAGAQKKFKESLFDRDFEAKLTRNLLAKGYSPEQVKAMVETAEWARKNGVAISNELYQIRLKTLDIEQKNNKVIEDRNKSEKDRTKELKEQLKTHQRLIGISGNSGIGTGAHLDVRYGGSRDGQKVSPEHIARLQAGGKSLSSYRVSSDYGQRKAPTAGASSFHKGIDFAMPVGTPITTKVAVKDVKTAYDPKGGGYYSTVTFEDGVVLKLLHQSPSMQSKVKGGASTGTYGSHVAQDKAEAKTEQEVEALRSNYRTLGERDEVDHIKRVKDLRKNGLDELVADENARFEKTKQLRQFEFTMEVDGWRWVGEEKIKNDAFAKKLRVEASTEFNKKEKAESIRSIDEQREYELEQFRLTKEQQLLQSKEFYMSELQMAQAKYDIERRLLDQSNEDPKEKSFKTQMLALQHQADLSRRLRDASTGWESVQAQMNGSTGRYQVSQDRLSRMGVSQNLLETQSADVENQEQEPGADLQKLAEVREQIWAAHNQRMIDIENQYQTDSLNLQLTQAQQLTGSFANMFKGILGESSGAYKTMFAMQQGFALTQAGMNLWSSVSDAYAKEPGTVWQKVAAGAKAALDQGTFLAMIQAITPQGFATGGPITGKGTGTSDDIPIMASNGEFMMRQYAASKIGLVALNYMNQTGEIPFQREYIGMKSQYLGSTQPDLNVQKFKDGGLVGVTRINNADAERSQFNSVLQTNIGSSQPKVTIINQTSQPVEATTQWDGSELQVVLKEMQKQNEAQTKSLISQSWRDAERQGGALDRIKKGR
ncbi:tape measure protein [Acinetobacter guillouiae]|uniref:tape measure protein n=1 Tax=Acinetobacter guillouiae TaxID=106649 RepID=UPI003AF5B663